ncbi:MAG: hypothetical protein IJP39_04835 [Bacteroidales bacterium]|nr:hypothetical protein [Bacteroidales bacterium]
MAWKKAGRKVEQKAGQKVEKKAGQKVGQKAGRWRLRPYVRGCGRWGWTRK